MRCKDARAAISARVDGEDIGFDREALEAHLAQCLECRAEADAVGRIGKILRSAAAPVPSASFDERVLDGLSRRSWFDRLCDWFEVPARRVAVALAFSGVVVSCMVLVPQTPVPPAQAPLAILDMQTDWADIDFSHIYPVQPTPPRRSEGGTIKCV